MGFEIRKENIGFLARIVLTGEVYFFNGISNPYYEIRFIWKYLIVMINRFFLNHASVFLESFANGIKHSYQ